MCPTTATSWSATRTGISSTLQSLIAAERLVVQNDNEMTRSCFQVSVDMHLTIPFCISMPFSKTLAQNQGAASGNKFLNHLYENYRCHKKIETFYEKGLSFSVCFFFA